MYGGGVETPAILLIQSIFLKRYMEENKKVRSGWKLCEAGGEPLGGKN